MNPDVSVLRSPTGGGTVEWRHSVAAVTSEAEFLEVVTDAARLASREKWMVVVASDAIRENDLRDCWAVAGLPLDEPAFRLVPPAAEAEGEPAILAPAGSNVIRLVDRRAAAAPGAEGGQESAVAERERRVCIYDVRTLPNARLIDVVTGHDAIYRAGGFRENALHFRAASGGRSAEPLFRHLIEGALTLEQSHQELLRRAAALEQSNQDLERFAFLASHDLQEPLRMISGYVDLIRMELGPSIEPHTLEYMEQVVRGVHRMRTMVGGLLSLSRISTTPLAKELVESKEPLLEALQNLRSLIEENHAHVEMGALPLVRANRASLAQVFQNLVANGIRFHGDAPPRVVVSARLEPPEWVFAVEDNGMGIRPEDASDIFRPFRTRSPAGGSGLGLVLTKRLVERMDGRIWFQSEPRRGTTFFFTLPAL